MQIAIKKLTNSDLSFFKVHLKLSKQKAINLNSNVFIEQFFPSLSRSFETIQLQLAIVGPSGKQPYWLSRKVLRSRGAKNWRLNGEFVHDLDEDPNRFSQLIADDYAILAFEGNDRPTALTLILVGQSEDADLHSAMSKKFSFAGRETMISVSDADISDLRQQTDGIYSGDHPLDLLQIPDTIEDALFTPITSKRKTPTGKSVALTQEQLQRQLQSAQDTGQIGEELFRIWLIARGHDETDFEWTSLTYARSAYDFEISNPKWNDTQETVYVDVKTTKGPFSRAFHMSLSELKWAAEHSTYRIARIYEIESDTPKMKLLTGITDFARDLLQTMDSFPEGVIVDSVTMASQLFKMEIEATIPKAEGYVKE